MITSIFIILFSLVCTGILASFEVALVNSDPLKIYAHIKERKVLKRLMNLFQNPSSVINALVIASNLFNIMIAVYSFSLFKIFYPTLMAAVIATIFTVLTILFFGEILPKLIAISASRFIITRFLFIIRVLMFIISPLVRSLNLIVRIFSPNIIQNQNMGSVSRKDLEFLFHKNHEEFQSRQLVEMVYRVFVVDNTRVKEAKVPINQIIAFPAGLSVKEFKEELRLRYHTRFPIYEGDIFNIVGHISTQQVLFDDNNDEKVLREYQLESLFIPEYKPVDEVMEIMDNTQGHIAFLVDEYGAVSGMVNRQDLNSLIIGNFQDDRKSSHSVFSMIKKGNSWIVPGRQDIDELNDMLGLNIKKDGFETLSGFMMLQINHIPKLGDHFIFNDFVFRVKEMRGYYCAMVEITPSQNPED